MTSYFSGTVRRDPSDGPDRGPRYRPQVALYLGRHEPHDQLVPQLGGTRPRRLGCGRQVTLLVHGHGAQHTEREGDGQRDVSVRGDEHVRVTLQFRTVEGSRWVDMDILILAPIIKAIVKSKVLFLSNFEMNGDVSTNYYGPCSCIGGLYLRQVAGH